MPFPPIHSISKLIPMDGRFLGQTFTGYQLNQSLKLKSKEVEKVEKISEKSLSVLGIRELTFYSQNPTLFTTPSLNHSNLGIDRQKLTEDANHPKPSDRRKLKEAW